MAQFSACGFTDQAPTAEFSAELAALSAGMDAAQLVELAQSVADTYVLQMDPSVPPLDEESAAYRAEMRTFCGFDKPYTPDNDPCVWRALTWLGLSHEQWAAMAHHWKDGTLNPCAMAPPFACSDSTAPIVMIRGRRTGELTVVRPVSRPELTIQIGNGVLGGETLAAFHAMVADRQASSRQHGGPPYWQPPLALVHGVPYYRDDCQWSCADMREVEMRSERSLNTRIWLQFLGPDHNGYYVPM